MSSESTEKRAIGKVSSAEGVEPTSTHCYIWIDKRFVGGKAMPNQEMYLRLWGRLLLEIRKDVGNKDTELNELDMLRWLIKDIDKLRDVKEWRG